MADVHGQRLLIPFRSPIVGGWSCLGRAVNWLEPRDSRPTDQPARLEFPGQPLEALLPMNEVTRILSAIEQGDPHASAELLPLVYDALRRLAAEKMAQESPGQTLQATALVHDAYLRLVGGAEAQHWNSRGHFFAAAAESMRRILVENARRKQRIRHGGELQRVDLDSQLQISEVADDDLLALDEAIQQLTAEEPQAAEVVKLRYFAGLTIEETALALNISVRTVNRHWAYARAWLYQQLH
jgi:RNA polymerase sigma factor (TIGR02999 family)